MWHTRYGRRCPQWQLPPHFAERRTSEVPQFRTHNTRHGQKHHPQRHENDHRRRRYSAHVHNCRSLVENTRTLDGPASTTAHSGGQSRLTCTCNDRAEQRRTTTPRGCPSLHCHYVVSHRSPRSYGTPSAVLNPTAPPNETVTFPTRPRRLTSLYMRASLRCSANTPCLDASLGA